MKCIIYNMFILGRAGSLSIKRNGSDVVDTIIDQDDYMYDQPRMYT